MAFRKESGSVIHQGAWQGRQMNLFVDYLNYCQLLSGPMYAQDLWELGICAELSDLPPKSCLKRLPAFRSPWRLQ